jgi:biopolymer transport protein ExbB/TolQ
VVILLIFLCLWLMVYAGGFLAELVKRKHFRSDRHLVNFLKDIKNAKALPHELSENLPLHVASYANELNDIVHGGILFRDEKVEDLNQRKEHSLTREVDKIRLIVRIGPSLGLMGTLIPMGTGLAGLTQGNMAQVTEDMRHINLITEAMTQDIEN